MKYRIIITTIIIVALGFIAVHSVDFKQLSGNLQKFPRPLLYVALTISTAITLLKTWRLRILLRKNNINPGLWPSYKLFAASQAITALPGGEASRAFFVTRETNASLHNAATPVLIQALLELFSAISVVIICSLFYPQLLMPGLIGMALLIGIVLILTNSRILTKLLTKGSRWQTIKNHSEKIKEIQKDLIKSIFLPQSYLPNNTTITAFVLGLFTNVVGGILMIVIATGFNQDISLLNAVFAYAGAVAIQGLATISPGGLGFTEGGMTGILHVSGVEHAFEIVLIYRFVTFIYYTLLGMLFILLFYRKDILTTKKGT